MEEFLFVEKYRPSRIVDCILPDRIKLILQKYSKEEQIPNLLFEGPPGNGKTTAAIALCNDAGAAWHKINASANRGIDSVRNEIVSFASTVSLDGKRKVIIMDEADFLTAEAQAALRGVIEQFSSNCTFILTCNFKAKLMNAIDSRMASISFKFTKEESPLLATMLFKRLKEILNIENISYEENVLAMIIQKYFPDFRKTLGEIQRLSKMNGSLDDSVISQLNGIKNLKEMVDLMKAKDFGKLRKWVSNNSDIDPVSIYRGIYDSLKESLQPQSIPVAILIIADYQYKHVFVPDPEINLVACLTRLMQECQFHG